MLWAELFPPKISKLKHWLKVKVDLMSVIIIKGTRGLCSHPHDMSYWEKNQKIRSWVKCHLTLYFRIIQTQENAFMLSKTLVLCNLLWIYGLVVKTQQMISDKEYSCNSSVEAAILRKEMESREKLPFGTKGTEARWKAGMNLGCRAL